MLSQYGVQWQGSKPLSRVREGMAVIDTFLKEGVITHNGEFFNYTGLFTSARPVQERVPLKIGAMGGPKSFELAGEIFRWAAPRPRVLEGELRVRHEARAGRRGEGRQERRPTWTSPPG